jgi:hypothetical protein
MRWAICACAASKAALSSSLGDHRSELAAERLGHRHHRDLAAMLAGELEPVGDTRLGDIRPVGRQQYVLVHVASSL